MATRDDLLQAGIDIDKGLVGPSVVLLQAEANYAFTGIDGTAYPRYIEDIVDTADGLANVTNGWAHLGLTENVNFQRARNIIYHDADQVARYEEVHDSWEETIVLTSLEMSLEDFQELWLGKAGDPVAVAGAPAAQQEVRFGEPQSIANRRVAIIHPDKFNVWHAFAFRKCSVRPTGGPTFTRTGRVEMPVEITVKVDTRVTDVDARVFTYFKTDAAVS